MRTKYPPIECNYSDYLAVSSHHEIYFEESGNPKGIPVIFLHGGPGAGTNPGHRSYFHPEKYRIILMDQRGCGKSRPFSSLVDNTTQYLVEDIEKLKKHLKIDRWVVFGGSWGSTLALCYAETFPKSVRALVVRGIFLGRKKEIDWFYQSGAHYLFPDEFEKYEQCVPLEKRGDFVGAYYQMLTDKDPMVRKKAAAAWSSWEACALKLIFDPNLFADFTQDDHADALARLECHYFKNRCFFQTDNQLIENIDVIRNIDGIIIQGRYDIVCPMLSAYELSKAWPEAQFEVIKDAGHSASEVGITDALIRATDHFAQKLQ